MNNNGLSSWVKTLLHLSSYIIWKKHFCWKAINFLMPSLNNSCYNAFGNRMEADNRNVYSKIKKRSYPRITIFASCFDINWPFTNYHMLGIVYPLWFLYFTGCQHPLTIFSGLSVSDFLLISSSHFCVMMFKILFAPNQAMLRYVVHL